MTRQDLREVQHEVTVAAPGAAVFRLLAEVGNWPRIFPPTVYVEALERGHDQERIRIWATANGTVKNWTSVRRLDPADLRIEFHQEVTAPPVAAMSGTWVVEPLGEGRSRVRLLHHYRAVDDDPDSLRWIDEAVDRNSRSELAALRTNLELAHGSAELTFSFVDTVRVAGPASAVYEFVAAADRWPERLPHVASVRLDEESPGVQCLEMDTLAPDGSVHTTRSYRVCFPHHRIAYKQVVLPALLTMHTGYWTFTDGADGTTAASQHTVVLNAENIPRILGTDATVADARDYVRNALSANSRATLGYAKDFVESRR
ncbi:MAG TPA: aromatase/cyclase [Actinophytocola sp.]|uniref:aromatase/cyclase n=1 Tax=Actinophytocola sp. TaxID=1872138 RepID=UPI002DB91998|nr:aromatase/cyclase [Actinophytocola sp.]HEU5472968.1 aromatase/cyclase [Actinophytocola sp.]